MMPSGFNSQPTLEGETLVLRPLERQDLGGLQAAAADPLIWAGHPAKDRHIPHIFAAYFDLLLSSGATLVVTRKADGGIVGCSRYYPAPDHPDSIGIGYTFLTRAHWGGGANFEMKRLMFGHAFKHVDTVWLHIDPANIRSQQATARLGAVHAYSCDLDLGGGAAPWQSWSITKDAWAARLAR